MYAIVKTGGKQYKVAPGDKLNIEKDVYKRQIFSRSCQGSELRP